MIDRNPRQPLLYRVRTAALSWLIGDDITVLANATLARCDSLQLSLHPDPDSGVVRQHFYAKNVHFKETDTCRMPKTRT